MQPSWNILDHCWHVLTTLLSLQLYFWSEVNEIIGRHQSHKSSLCSDLSLENINDFLYCGCYRWSLPCQILFGTSYLTKFVLLSLNSSQSDPLMYYQSGTLTLRNLLAQMVSQHILQQTAEIIAEPLTLIYNHSLNTGTVPLAWKRSNVTPV